MKRREFLQMLAVASAGGMLLTHRTAAAQAADAMYDLPRFGNVQIGRAHV